MVNTSRSTELAVDAPLRSLLRKFWIDSCAVAAVSSLPLTCSERRTPRRAKSRAVGLLEMGTVGVVAAFTEEVDEGAGFSLAVPGLPMAWRACSAGEG